MANLKHRMVLKPPRKAQVKALMGITPMRGLPREQRRAINKAQGLRLMGHQRKAKKLLE